MKIYFEIEYCSRWDSDPTIKCVEEVTKLYGEGNTFDRALKSLIDLLETYEFRESLDPLIVEHLKKEGFIR